MSSNLSWEAGEARQESGERGSAGAQTSKTAEILNGQRRGVFTRPRVEREISVPLDGLEDDGRNGRVRRFHGPEMME